MRCNEAMRRQGVQIIPRTCAECRLGPCMRVIEALCAVQTLQYTIPQRLHGVAVNDEGDAI